MAKSARAAKPKRARKLNPAVRALLVIGLLYVCLLYTSDMERIMRLMDTITQVDISEEDYPLRAEDGMELLREDAVAPSLPAEEILGNAKGCLLYTSRCV